MSTVRNTIDYAPMEKYFTLEFVLERYAGIADKNVISVVIIFLMGSFDVYLGNNKSA